MPSTPKVLLTVNPGLIAGKRMMTVRSMVAALDKQCDLFILPIDGYDFKRKKAVAYRRQAGGKFRRVGAIEPEGDLWIVYTDGYYLDAAQFGFSKRLAYLKSQIDFHEHCLATGKVKQVVNKPTAEKTTLKSWFSQLANTHMKVIPTYQCSTFSAVRRLQKQKGTLVAKPDWGGAGTGVVKLVNDADVKKLERLVQRNGTHEDLGDYAFQEYMPGDEKRLWFLGDRCIAGRITHGRRTPWSDSTEHYHVKPYSAGARFETDRLAAEKIWKKSGLTIGSVDFLGDYINEINGCGTIFTDYQYWQQIVDARPQLCQFLLEMIGRCQR